MANQKDFYKVLGVSKTATADEIKKAYRKLAMQYHPDKFEQASEAEKKNATEKFKEITEAYLVLSNDSRRRAYDRTSSSSYEYTRQSYGSGTSSNNAKTETSDETGFDDILEELDEWVDKIIDGIKKFTQRNANKSGEKKNSFFDDILENLDSWVEKAFGNSKKTENKEEAKKEKKDEEKNEKKEQKESSAKDKMSSIVEDIEKQFEKMYEKLNSLKF